MKPHRIIAIFATLLFFSITTVCAIAVNQANAQEKPPLENKTPKEMNALEDKNTFGDWKVSCPENGPCRMAQSIVLQSSQIPILQMRVFKGKKPTALFSFPLGILLNTGWQIKIDRGKSRLLPFEICKLDGCHSGINIPAKLLRELKNGNILHIKFFDSNQKPIEPKISLKGFTKAYGALK